MHDDKFPESLEPRSLDEKEIRFLSLFRINYSIVEGFNAGFKTSLMGNVADSINEFGIEESKELIFANFNDLITSILIFGELSYMIDGFTYDINPELIEQNKLLHKHLNNIPNIKGFIQNNQNPKFLDKMGQYLKIQVNQFQKTHSRLCKKLFTLKEGHQITMKGEEFFETTLINLEKTTRVTESIISILKFG